MWVLPSPGRELLVMSDDDCADLRRIHRDVIVRRVRDARRGDRPSLVSLLDQYADEVGVDILVKDDLTPRPRS
jgi:hypothetical protein